MDPSSPNITVAIEDFDKICRTCLGSEKLISIPETLIGDLKIVDLLESTVLIDLNNEFLPQNICEACLNKFYNIYEFKKHCEDIENVLKMLLATSQSDDEINKDVKCDVILEESDEEKYELNAPGEDTTCDVIEPKSESNDSKKSEFETEHHFEIQCPQCIYIATDIHDLQRHRKEVKHPRYRRGHHECEICGKVLTRSDFLRQHMRIHTDERPYKCEFCSEAFRWRGDLIRHKKDYGNTDHVKKEENQPKTPLPKKGTCEICNKTFVHLRAHMKIHTNEKPFQCEMCPQAFGTRRYLKNHEMKHKGERPYLCSICGKSFIRSTNLQIHEKIHEKHDIIEGQSPEDLREYKFTCDYCGRGFRRLTPFNNHLKRHTSKIVKKENQSNTSNNARGYVCDICGRSYKNKLGFSQHRLTHGEKSFLCSVCGKGFFKKSALQSHFIIHTGEKPHTCTVCNKSFSHTASFNAHRLIHLGVRPYKCKICLKTFNHGSHLKRHMRTHTGEKPYSCSYCDKTFALKINMTVHERSHTGEKPFKCPVCAKGFYDSSSMKKHWRTHKNVAPKTEPPESREEV